jgi:hypothetical protein
LWLQNYVLNICLHYSVTFSVHYIYSIVGLWSCIILKSIWKNERETFYARNTLITNSLSTIINYYDKRNTIWFYHLDALFTTKVIIWLVWTPKIEINSSLICPSKILKICILLSMNSKFVNCIFVTKMLEALF